MKDATGELPPIRTFEEYTAALLYAAELIDQQKRGPDSPELRGVTRRIEDYEAWVLTQPFLLYRGSTQAVAVFRAWRSKE